MNRFALVCSLLVGALAGCDTLFPGPGGGQSGSLTGLGPDGGVCEKDPQTIKNVMLAPPICNATNPCPCGTFCSSQTGGNCVADCVDDTWCAPGHFCSGYGQCLAGSADGGTGDGPDPNVDPSCPRNEALLDSLHVMRRSCQFDDICPFGSFCDHVQESCDYACRSDAQCAGMNSPGHTFVCNCLGKCAEVAAPRVKAEEVVASLEATPGQYIFPRPATITAPDWGGLNERLVSVVVVAPVVTTNGSTITGPTVTVQANPGPGLMVRCPGMATPSAMPCSFTVDPATFRSKDDVYRSAPLTVVVQPSAGAPTATSWELRLTSNQISNSPKVVTLRYAEAVVPVAGANVQEVTAPDPGFMGTGIVEIGTPTGAILRMAVKARAYQGDLVLFDETQQLSPSGKLVLRRWTDYTTFQAFVYPATNNDVALQDSLTGVNLQSINDYHLQKDFTSGSLNGTFQRAIFSSFPIGSGSAPLSDVFNTATNASFSLEPVTSSAVGACSGNNDCPTGTTCDLGFCSDLPAHQFNPFANGIGGGGGPFDTEMMRHKRMNRWNYHWAAADMSGDTQRNGHFGFYLPNSSYQSTAASERWAYSLHGPLPQISGEPLADLLDGYGYVVASNLKPLAVPLVTQHDGSGPFFFSASDLLRECVNDLSRDRVNPNPFFSGADYETFDTYVNCINLGRVAWAMRDRQTFQHALQGWLDVHSFVLGEGVEELRLAEATAGVPGTQNPTNPPVTLERLLGIGESGLGFLIDVSAGGSGSFKNSTPYEIRNYADFRPFHLGYQACSKDADCNIGDGSPTMTCNRDYGNCQLMTLKNLPQHEQPIGVPTKILETATAYLKALDAYLAKIARETYGQPADGSPSNNRRAALARYGTGMRLVLFAEQLAVGINAKQDPCYGENCAYIDARFAAVRDEMNAVRTRCVSDANAIRLARNPFDIPEDDVPLFFGDPNGTNSKYFAASDYLLNGWAIPAVGQAQSYLDAARSSWLAQLQAKVQDELNSHNREQEINQLMSKYGSQILTSCGNMEVPVPGGTKRLDTMGVIPYLMDSGMALDSSTCFIEPMCLDGEGLDGKRPLQKVLSNAFLDQNGDLIQEPVTSNSTDFSAGLFVRAEVCRLTYVQNAYSGSIKFLDHMKDWCPANTSYPAPNRHDLSSWCWPEKRSDGNVYFKRGNHQDGYIPLAVFYGPVRRQDIGPNGFYRDAWDGPGSDEDIYDWYDIRSDRDYHRTRVIFADFFNTAATNSCASNTALSLHETYPRPNRKDLPGECYKGALGVAYQQVATNLLRIKRAKEVLDGGQKGAEDQMKLCAKIDKNGADLDYHTQLYNEMKSVYGTISSFAGSVEKGIDVGMKTGNVYAGIFAGVANFGLSMFGKSIEDEARDLALMEQRFSLEEKSMACWNTFRSMRRALATAMTDVQIAATEMNAQATVFRNLSGANDLAIQEGQAVLRQERASPVSRLAHVFWVNEKVEQYRKEFEWSRRLAFIAMRAVEYEFQQSLPFRSQIVAATNPAQLQDVLIGLQQEQAARTINRRRPEEASVVLSLRDDVLAVADRSDDPTGERNWSPAQRFMSRLWDDRYAVRDDDGNYLGQGIPFALGPTGVLETRCGERVWRATATIQGDGIEASAPGASVLLLKRNTFSSQYCNGKTPPVTTLSGATIPGPQMQIGVVHTAAQLFRPGANVDLSDANEFTAAMLYPWFNVRKTDFYKTGFRDGASEELAGRGLYGDYVLLFPKQVLDEGLALDKVEDVLLRLDYLSVDNLSQ